MWDVARGTKVHESKDLCKGLAEDGALDVPGMAMRMEFDAAGRRLVVGTQEWCTLTMWRTADWQFIQPPLMMGHSVADLCFMPGSGGTLWSTDFLGQCIHYDRPPYRKGLDPLPHVKLNAPVLDAAVSPDGRWFAAGALNRKALIFNAETFEFSPPVLEHNGEVTAVDWSPDGRRLLTATAAGEVNVWDRVTGRRVYAWPQEKAVVQAAFALGGSCIVIAQMDGKLLMREVYAGGRRPEAGTAALLEKLSGYRVGAEGQLLPWRGE